MTARSSASLSPSTSPSQTPSLSTQPNPAKRKRSNHTKSLTRPIQPPTTRELLSTSQKQSNHRNAETRRRQDILERLTIICDEMVPGARGLAKSTEVAYTKAHEYLRDLLIEKRALIAEIEALGGQIGDKEKEAIRALDKYGEISSDEEDSDDDEDDEQQQNSEEETETADGDDDADDDDDVDNNDNNGEEEGERQEVKDNSVAATEHKNGDVFSRPNNKFQGGIARNTTNHASSNQEVAAVHAAESLNRLKKG